MMIFNYKEFLNESQLYDLILESKFVISDSLKSILKEMPDNKVKDLLISMDSSQEDYNLNQNYFDISKTNKEEFTFVQDSRAQRILGSEELLKYRTLPNSRTNCLNFNMRNGEYVNQAIYDELNFDPETTQKVNPNQGEIGEILAETPSKKTPGKIWALFKWGDDKISVVNKEYLEKFDDRLNRVWSTNRNPIRIGRAINALANVANVKLNQAEVESFVNLYKSGWEIINNAFIKFSVVRGLEIAKWYHYSTYEPKDYSTLHNSCMKAKSPSYFRIYTHNPDVCGLVILYSNDGELVDGQWKSDKIKGRAILWTLTNGETFMDRIYYNDDSDVDLFKKYADSNGWYYKKHQDSDEDFEAVSIKGNIVHPKWYVKLKTAECDKYPYVDTMCYINVEDKMISNSSSFSDYYMRDTSGELERDFDDDDYDEDYDD